MLLSNAEFNLGAWYPAGGINKLVSALEKLCRENGVEIITNQKVTSINVTSGKCTEVIAGNNKYSCDLVISNSNYPYTEKHLLSKEYREYSDSYWNKAVYSQSAFMIYLGIKGNLQNISHHNLYFCENWEQSFKDMSDKSNLWPDDPSFYFYCPSKVDESLAPEGCDLLTVLVPVSIGLNDSEENRNKFTDKIISKYEKITGEKIKDRIIVKRYFRM